MFKDVRNDASLASILVECNEQVEVIPGQLLYSSFEGECYGYVWGKVDQVVVVPDDYPYKFVKGRRVIRVLAGQAIASPWGDGAVCMESSIVIASLVRGKLISEAINSISGAGDKKWIKWALIIGGILIVGYFGYNLLFGGDGAVPGGNVSPTATPEIVVNGSRWD